MSAQENLIQSCRDWFHREGAYVSEGIACVRAWGYKRTWSIWRIRKTSVWREQRWEVYVWTGRPSPHPGGCRDHWWIVRVLRRGDDMVNFVLSEVLLEPMSSSHLANSWKSDWKYHPHGSGDGNTRVTEGLQAWDEQRSRTLHRSFCSAFSLRANTH